MGRTERVAAVLTLELFGGFALRRADGSLVALPRKAQALLGFLALAGNREVTRERLAGLLWEDSPEGQARTSLRQALAGLRRACPPHGLLVASTTALALDPGAVQVDVQTFETLASGDSAQRLAAASLWRGDLMEGLEGVGTGWAAWLAAERSRLRAMAVRLVEEAAAAAIAARRADEAVALGLRLVAIEPLHEGGHRQLMRAFAVAGRHGEALRHYRSLQELLRAELGVAPEPETVALAAELSGRRRAGAEPPGAEPAAPAGQAPAAEQSRPLPAAPVGRELRRIAVLDIGLASPPDPAGLADMEAAHARLSAWHALVDRAVEAAGGQVHDRMGDVAVALFGARQARLDDPARAASAALAALGEAAGLGLSARAGVAAGTVLIAPAHGAAAAIGAAVTEAGRLRALAGAGDVLASSGLVAELSPRLATRPAGPGRIRIEARPAGVPAAGAEATPLIGRDRELAQLEALLAAVRLGRGMTVLLRGEPGIGKSRLVEAMVARAAAEGFGVAVAEISDFGERASLSPRRQLATALATLPGAAAHVAEQPRRIQLAHDQILGRTIESPGAGEAIGEPERIAAIEGVIAAVARRAPLLLAVEDAHWANADGLAQIGRMSRLAASHAVFLLVTVRAEEDPFDLGWRQAAGPLLTIDLPPLDHAAATGAARAFGAGALAEACARRANGNPLVLRQLVAAVADGAEVEEALPGSVQSLTLGRLDRLDPASREALAAAAILGRESELGAVRAVAGLPGWVPPPEALGALVRLEGEPGVERLRFAHALVRDAVRAALLDSEARARHARAGGHYRATRPDVAARHLARAGDPTAAALFGEAAQAALASHRADKALALAEEGAQAGRPEGETLARLMLVKATALIRLRRAGDAVAAAQTAVAAAQRPETRVLARIAEADARNALLEADAALAVLGVAEAEAEAADLAEPLARIATLEGTIHFPRGEIDACLAANARALVWARRAGSALAEAGAHAGLAWAHYQAGDFARGMAEADAALALAQAPAFDRVRLSALRVRAVTRTFLLDHDGALADAAEAIALAEEQADVVHEVLARTTGATVHLECWRHREAIALVEPAFALARPLARIGIEAAPLWVMGTATGALGNAGPAEDYLRQARALAAAGPIRFALPRILGTLAFFTGADERARLVAEGETILAEMRVAHSGLGFWSAVLLAALAHDEPGLARRAEAGLVQFGGAPPVPWADALLTLARTFVPLAEGRADGGVRAAAAAFHARARATPALSWLRPVMRIAEIRAGVATPAGRG